MTVNGLLTAMIDEITDLDDAVLENVWNLAERSNDTEAMLSMLRRRGELPRSVLTRARAAKDPAMRVAYLCRRDVDAEERSELLESEKRAEVFAGLVGVAKNDADLARRLYDQFTKKPTKVLARVLLRQDFEFEDIAWRCTLLLINDKSLSQPLEQRMQSVIREASADAEKVKEILSVLPDRFVEAIDASKVGDENLAAFVERLKETASRSIDRWDYAARRVRDSAATTLTRIASREQLPDHVVTLLDVMSGSAELPTAPEIATLLAARLACSSSSVDERQQEARAASGTKLEHLFHMAFTSGVNETQSLVQGLLENPEAWRSERFEALLRQAKPVSLIRAMEATRSPELLALIWGVKLDGTPADCWKHVDDAEAVQLSIVEREVSRSETAGSYSPLGGRINALLQCGVSKNVVASLPFRLFNAPRWNNWASRSLLRACSVQLVELQSDFLGSDPSAWENFNNLASDWSGSLGELLEASRNL